MSTDTMNTTGNTVGVYVVIDWFDGSLLHRLDIDLNGKVGYYLSKLLDDGHVIKTLRWHANVPKDLMPTIINKALNVKSSDDFKALLDMIAPYRV